MSTPVIAIPSSFLGNLASSTVQIVLDQQKSFLSSLLMSSAYGKGHATGVAIATEVRTFTATLTQSGSLPYAGTRQASASSASAYSAASANHFHINTSSNANFSFIKAPPMISPLSTTSNRFGERLNSNEPIAAQTSPYHGNANSNQHGYHHAHIHSGYLINSGEAVAITQATKDSKGTLIGGSVTAISPNADEGSPHSEDIVSATDSPYANAGEGLPSGPDTNNAASDIDQKDPMNAGMSVAPTSGPYAAAQTSYASSNESFGVGGAGSMNTTAPLPFYSGAWLGRSLGSVIYVLGFAICGVFAL
ncbi:hypothetical protein MMC21_003853 [Puttea exsequens]|nr:hypothetical protein [Puttea exsequens]